MGFGQMRITSGRSRSEVERDMHHIHRVHAERAAIQDTLKLKFGHGVKGILNDGKQRQEVNTL
jgi:hypothetical protein